MATRLWKTNAISSAIFSIGKQCKWVGRDKQIASSFHTTAQLERKVDFNLSDIGEGIREVTVKEWYVKEGDTVEQFDNLCEVQSDKASVTITSRYDGKISKLYHNVDDIAFVGKPLIAFDVNDDESSGAKKVETAEAIESVDRPARNSDNAGSREQVWQTDPNQINGESQSQRRIVLTTPAVRRIANENKVDLKQVIPSGKLGRVLKSDVLEFLNILPSTIDQNKPKPVAPQSITSKSPAIQSKNIPIAQDRVEKLKGVRKMMLKSMTESLKIPHFVYSDEVDVTKLVQLRQALKAETNELGIKLTFMPFFIKAASLALSQYPILNSSFDGDQEAIVYKSAHNISVAMATPDGLVVPNIKNCQTKTINQIATDLQELLLKGQRNQLTPDDFVNGTFSLSNIGVIGGTYTQPCILAPQVSIGAIGTTKIIPKFGANDEIIKAHVIHVSWSADHRVIDGVTMANFSNAWKKYVENPELFILQ